MNAQALKIAAADRATLIANFGGAAFAHPTKALRETLLAFDIKLTEDRINKALGRFHRNYGGKLSALTPHKALMLEKARQIAPFPLCDKYLLDTIGQADTERGAMARISKMLQLH